MNSQITIDDGTTSINIDGVATLGLRQEFEEVPGGSRIIRFLDGSAIKQSNRPTLKRRITITGDGWVPPELLTIDFNVELTITIQDYSDPSGVLDYTVLAESVPRETWNVNTANISWSCVFEES